MITKSLAGVTVYCCVVMWRSLLDAIERAAMTPLRSELQSSNAEFIEVPEEIEEIRGAIILLGAILIFDIVGTIHRCIV